VLEQVPELRVALCHCGSPWDQSDAGLAAWRDGLRAFAALPNTVCKVSGLGMFNPGWTVEDLRPIVLAVIELFGPGRVMFGSNFPVDKLYRPYADYWAAYDSLTAGCGPVERDAMFAGNARGFYRMD
jgi:predicted TIM-barrel fold metal-dependent hydrolase